MTKRIFTFVLMLVVTITSSISVFAYSPNNSSAASVNEINIPINRDMSEAEITEMLSQSIHVESSGDTSYQIVFAENEEEARAIVDKYNNPNQRNILPNLVLMTLIKNNSYSVTLKVQNIAVDSLDIVYGYIFLYDNYGGNGYTSFRFTNIPPMGSDYATCTALYGPYNSGMFFVEAIDGTVGSSGVWYF